MGEESKETKQQKETILIDMHNQVVHDLLRQKNCFDSSQVEEETSRSSVVTCA